MDLETGEACAWAELGMCTFCAALESEMKARFQRGFEEPGDDEPLLVELATDAEASAFIRQRKVRT
jgi:hypothetical protein